MAQENSRLYNKVNYCLMILKTTLTIIILLTVRAESETIKGTM